MLVSPTIGTHQNHVWYSIGQHTWFYSLQYPGSPALGCHNPILGSPWAEMIVIWGWGLVWFLAPNDNQLVGFIFLVQGDPRITPIPKSCILLSMCGMVGCIVVGSRIRYYHVLKWTSARILIFKTALISQCKNPNQPRYYWCPLEEEIFIVEPGYFAQLVS